MWNETVEDAWMELFGHIARVMTYGHTYYHKVENWMEKNLSSKLSKSLKIHVWHLYLSLWNKSVNHLNNKFRKIKTPLQNKLKWINNKTFNRTLLSFYYRSPFPQLWSSSFYNYCQCNLTNKINVKFWEKYKYIIFVLYFYFLGENEDILVAIWKLNLVSF